MRIVILDDALGELSKLNNFTFKSDAYKGLVNNFIFAFQTYLKDISVNVDLETGEILDGENI